MVEKRLWICPALCGCKLNITAEWASDPIDGGDGQNIMYQHPKGFSITDLEIVTVCPEHAPLQNTISDDPYGGRPGYIKLPIDNPTPAQCLYIGLYDCHGNLHTLGCGCRLYKHFNKTTVDHHRYLEHPHKTFRCASHKHDHDHSVALADQKSRSSEENV